MSSYIKQIGSMKSTGMYTQYRVNALMFGLHGTKATSLEDGFSGNSFVIQWKDGTWRQQFLIPLPLYNPVFTIVIYG